MKKLLLVMLAIILFVGFALATDLNLSFEDNSDLTNWGVFVGSTGYTTKAWDASAGVDGSGALYFTDAGYGLMIERQSINVPSENNYSLSVDVKVADWTSSNDLTLSIIGLSNSEPSVVISDNSTYTTVTLNGVADKATSGYLRISGTGNAATPEIWIDNLVFDDNTEAAPEPTNAGNISVLDLRQDDNHYFEITDNANNDLDLGTDYTIEAWIYIKNTTHGDGRIFRSQGWQMYVVSGTGAGGADATVRVDGTFLPAGSINLTVPTEEWHHVAIQGNSAGWTNNYLDGTSIANGGTSEITGSLNLRIGSYSTETTDFIGCIDEVRISTGNRYSRWGFTVSKNDPPFTSDANTVLLYHFDDNAVPPTNNSSISFTTTNHGINTDDYLAYNDASLSGTDLALPITLVSFTAAAKNGKVELAWETATEVNNSHFVVYRNNEAIATINGAGTTTEPHTYSYVDEMVIPGVAYTYVLADVNYANEETLYEENPVTVVLGNDIIAADFIVDAAYPNPFNPSVTVSYKLSASEMVKASIYNINGALIKELLDENMTAGSHELVWNAANMPSGVYILKMISGNTVNTQKLVLNK